MRSRYDLEDRLPTVACSSASSRTRIFGLSCSGTRRFELPPTQPTSHRVDFDSRMHVAAVAVSALVEGAWLL